jgi:hypothetical protein
MTDPELQEPGYFVVFKIDRGNRRIFFRPHWDAGHASSTQQPRARREIQKSPRQLEKLAPDGHAAPFKVSVGPLGDVRPYRRD